MDTATKTGLDALKCVSEIEVHKTGEATVGVLGNKIADKLLKPKAVPNENLRGMLKKWLFHQRKQKKYQTNQGKYYKMEYYKASNLENNLTVSIFVTIKWIEGNKSLCSQ